MSKRTFLVFAVLALLGLAGVGVIGVLAADDDRTVGAFSTGSYTTTG
jgi:hypothetical protein